MTGEGVAGSSEHQGFSAGYADERENTVSFCHDNFQRIFITIKKHPFSDHP